MNQIDSMTVNGVQNQGKQGQYQQLILKLSKAYGSKLYATILNSQQSYNQQSHYSYNQQSHHSYNQQSHHSKPNNPTTIQQKIKTIFKSIVDDHIFRKQTPKQTTFIHQSTIQQLQTFKTKLIDSKLQHSQYEKQRLQVLETKKDTLDQIVNYFENVMKVSQFSMKKVKGYFENKCNNYRMNINNIQKMKWLYQCQNECIYMKFSTLLEDMDMIDEKEAIKLDSICKQIQNDVIEKQIINNLNNYNKQFESQKQEIIQLQKQIQKTTRYMIERQQKLVKAYDEKIECISNDTKKVSDEQDLFGLQTNYLIGVQDQVRQIRQYGKLVLDLWETIQEFEIQRLDIIKESFCNYYTITTHNLVQQNHNVQTMVDQFKSFKSKEEIMSSYLVSKVINDKILQKIKIQVGIQDVDLEDVENYFVNFKFEFPFQSSRVIEKMFDLERQVNNQIGFQEVWFGFSVDGYLHIFDYNEKRDNEELTIHMDGSNQQFKQLVVKKPEYVFRVNSLEFMKVDSLEQNCGILNSTTKMFIFKNKVSVNLRFKSEEQLLQFEEFLVFVQNNLIVNLSN